MTLFLASDPEWLAILADSDRAEQHATDQAAQDRLQDFTPAGPRGRPALSPSRLAAGSTTSASRPLPPCPGRDANPSEEAV